LVDWLKINRGKNLLTEEDRISPVSQGAIHDVKIDSIAREGDGIAHIQGLVIFVPGTKVGDQVTIKIERVMQRFAIAALTGKN